MAQYFELNSYLKSFERSMQNFSIVEVKNVYFGILFEFRSFKFGEVCCLFGHLEIKRNGLKVYM